MTTLVCDFIDIIGEPIDGVASLSTGEVRPDFSNRTVKVPHPVSETVVAGKATFSNVRPGKAVLTVHWEGRSATFRFRVPNAESIDLIDAVAGEGVEQSELDAFRAGIAAELYRTRNIVIEATADAEAAAERAADSADDAASSASQTADDRRQTREHRDAAQTAASDAHTHRQGALTHRESSNAHRLAAEAAKTSAESARDAAAGFRDGAKVHRDAAKVSEDNAGTSADSANTSANTAAAKVSEAEAKIQQALDAIASAENIEDSLRALMEDTEAWQNVQYALEQVDSTIAASMQQVKDDILVGVGPAYDTLLELAEAFGENRDTIVEIVDQLSKKAEKGHTHVSADITDAYHYMGTDNDAGRIVKAHSNGHIYMRTDPPAPDALARKAYVDAEVATKADKGHKHKSWDIENHTPYADAQAAANDMVVTGQDGFIHSRDNPTKPNQLARKGYVDQEVGKKANTSHTHSSADITDAHDFVGEEGSGGKVYKLRPDGQVWIRTESITLNGHAPNKAYVDQEVAKKADKSHAHTLADISGVPSNASPSAIEDSIVIRNASGYFSVVEPVSDSHAASKGYVDQEVAKKANTSHTHTLADISGVPSNASPSAVGDSFVIRNSSGHFSVTEPDAATHAVPRSYVDGRTPEIRVVSSLPSSPTSGVVYLVTRTNPGVYVGSTKIAGL